MSETETPAIDTTTEAIAEPAGNERDALIAAANAANKDTPAEAVKEEPKKEAAAVEGEPEKKEESKISKLLRDRERAQAEREERSTVKASLEKERAEVAKMRADAERMQSEAVAKLHKLKSSPLEAIKEIGWDRAALVDEVAREGTPEWQAQKRLEARLEESNSKIAKFEAWQEEQSKLLERQQLEQSSYAMRMEEKRFISLFPEKSAASKLFGSEDRLIAEGHRVGALYKEKSGGRVATTEEISEYIEQQAKERLDALRQELAGDTSKASTSASKVATQTKANGPRALSGSAASERRSSPKPRHEWTPQEEREHLKAAAEAVMK